MKALKSKAGKEALDAARERVKAARGPSLAELMLRLRGLPEVSGRVRDVKKPAEAG